MRGWRGRIDATGRVCLGAPQRSRSRSRFRQERLDRFLHDLPGAIGLVHVPTPPHPTGSRTKRFRFERDQPQRRRHVGGDVINCDGGEQPTGLALGLAHEARVCPEHDTMYG